jgi:tetratricopeptide (TPR) repeat protein
VFGRTIWRRPKKNGIDLARRALRVAGDDPYVLANAALALGLFGKDIASAIVLIDRALQLNPSFAYGWRWSGMLRLWAGQYDLAIVHLETSIRFNPRESRSQTYLIIGMSQFFARRNEKAAEMIGFSLQEKPTGYRHFALWLHAWPIWDDSKKREMSSIAYERLHPLQFRAQSIGGSARIENITWTVCAWPLALPLKKSQAVEGGRRRSGSSATRICRVACIGQALGCLRLSACSSSYIWRCKIRPYPV